MGFSLVIGFISGRKNPLSQNRDMMETQMEIDQSKYNNWSY